MRGSKGLVLSVGVRVGRTNRVAFSQGIQSNFSLPRSVCGIRAGALTV